jgi:hypothetical protein
MATLAVRNYLRRESSATVSVRDRHTALSTPVPDSGISVRDLLNRHTAYRLNIGSLTFEKATFRVGLAGRQRSPGGLSGSLAGSGPLSGSPAGDGTFDGSLAAGGKFDGSVLNHPRSRR